MNIIRKLKIDNYVPASFSKEEKEIVDFIKNSFENLIEFKCDKENSECIFFMNSVGDCMLYYHFENSFLCVNYEKVWKFLNVDKNIEHNNISYLITYMLSKILNKKIILTSFFNEISMYIVEDDFKKSTEFKKVNNFFKRAWLVFKDYVL